MARRRDNQGGNENDRYKNPQQRIGKGRGWKRRGQLGNWGKLHSGERRRPNCPSESGRVSVEGGEGRIGVRRKEGCPNVEKGSVQGLSIWRDSTRESKRRGGKRRPKKGNSSFYQILRGKGMNRD